MLSLDRKCPRLVLGELCSLPDSPQQIEPELSRSGFVTHFVRLIRLRHGRIIAAGRNALSCRLPAERTGDRVNDRLRVPVRLLDLVRSDEQGLVLALVPDQP